LTLQTQHLRSFGWIDYDVKNYPGVVSEVNPQLPKYPLFGWFQEILSFDGIGLFVTN
jgi:hypothetical protein